MSMSLDRRLQILLDEDRHERLVAAAQARGVSVATVVREAIDRGLSTSRSQRRNAADRILAAEDMPVGDIEQLRAELEALRSRHA